MECIHFEGPEMFRYVLLILLSVFPFMILRMVVGILCSILRTYGCWDMFLFDVNMWLDESTDIVYVVLNNISLGVCGRLFEL
jgi:hypothetical protein